MASGADATTPSWRCILERRFEVGTGNGKHIEYHAHSMQKGKAQQAVRFRYSELAVLNKELQGCRDLKGVRIPSFPPKFNFLRATSGQYCEQFQTQRFEDLQRWFDQLAMILQAKYHDVGAFPELCEPFARWHNAAADRGGLAEAAEVAEAARVAEISEDHNLVQEQNREYEEALKIDQQREEERRREEAAREEEERAARLAEEAAAARAEEERRKAEAAATVHAQQIEQRRLVFMEQVPIPAKGESQVQIRIRGLGGKTIARGFTLETRVSALFEWAEVSEWEGKASASKSFDLSTAHPVRSMRECVELTLAEAGLAPSAALLLREADEE